MGDGIVDQYGLNRENTLLVVNIPANNSALVFRVKQRNNAGQEKLIYGPLPIASGQSFALYSGGSVSTPQAGVFPAFSYVPSSQAMQFAAPNVLGQTMNSYDPSDLWFTPLDYRNILFEYRQIIIPKWIRIQVTIPSSQNQSFFQNGKVAGGVSSFPAAFGFSRGVYDIVQIPFMHYGWLYGNDTNLSVLTNVKFIYGEYSVEIPKNPNVIFDAISGLIPSRHVTLPAFVPSSTLTDSLNRTYGIQGFPIYPLSERGTAIQVYQNLLGQVLI